jgi:circadian clock protein KaiC
MDNVVLLRYAELESEIRRALGVIKMRESDHVKSLVEFVIDENGLRVGGKFAGVAGVLTGTPVRTEEKFREFFGR